MTDNQRKAYDELSLYKEAKKDLRHMSQEIEALETKINRSTRACHSLMRETWCNGRFIQVPVVVQTKMDGNPAEALMDILMEQRIHYMSKQRDAENTCMMIEVNISRRCDGINARFLRSYFLHSKRLEKIAVDENLAYSSIKRVKWRALEMYGSKMTKRE